MKKVRILDLDNCISDDGWRISRIDWHQTNLDRRYHDYHSLAPFDLLGNGQLVCTPCDIAIFTARPVSYRAATEEWLRRNAIRSQYLIMRNDGNHMPSDMLKRQQVEWLVAHYGVGLYDIEMAFDDRPEVVEMYKSLGIKAEVAAIHNLCAYSKPGYKPSIDLMREASR